MKATGQMGTASTGSKTVATQADGTVVTTETDPTAYNFQGSTTVITTKPDGSYTIQVYIGKNTSGGAFETATGNINSPNPAGTVGTRAITDPTGGACYSSGTCIISTVNATGPQTCTFNCAQIAKLPDYQQCFQFGQCGSFSTAWANTPPAVTAVNNPQTPPQATPAPAVTPAPPPSSQPATPPLANGTAANNGANSLNPPNVSGNLAALLNPPPLDGPGDTRVSGNSGSSSNSSFPDFGLYLGNTAYGLGNGNGPDTGAGLLGVVNNGIESAGGTALNTQEASGLSVALIGSIAGVIVGGPVGVLIGGASAVTGLTAAINGALKH